jgi:hypothetical protein
VTGPDQHFAILIDRELLAFDPFNFEVCEVGIIQTERRFSAR